MLAGYGHLGSALLQGLLEFEGCTVVGAFPWSTRQGTKKDTDLGEQRLIRLARQHGLLNCDCPGINSFEFMRQVQALAPDILLVGSWGEILKPHVLQEPRWQVINCHPSYLPAHRGANPYVSVIRAGESATGVSFHIMEEAVDAGPILLQETLPVLPTDTGGSLRDRCADMARSLIPELITRWRNNTPPRPQNEAKATYYPVIQVEDGLICWEDAPERIYNQVRGLQPWLDCYTYWKGQLMAIRQVCLKEQAGGSNVLLNTPPGTIVAVEDATIWVQSAEPNVWMGLKNIRLYQGIGLLPGWLSWMLVKRWAAPGQQLTAGPERR